MQKDFVSTDLPGNVDAYIVQQGDTLTDIFKKHYSDYEIKDGDDFRVLATAILVANRCRKGVQINEDQFKASLRNNVLVNFADPWNAENRAVYQSIQVVEGTNIILPDKEYIQMLKDTGVVTTRPEFVQVAMEIAKGLAGFTAGVLQGFYEGIVDMFVGIWDLVKSVIDVIDKILTGEIIDDIKTLYEELSKLDMNKLKELGLDILKGAISGLEEMLNNWNKASTYEKANMIGKMVGNLTLEILLAIFTGGSANAAKWIGRIGKVSPRLAATLQKAVTKVDKILPDSFKKSQKKNDPDSDSDSTEGQKTKAIIAAKAIVEMNDAKDTPVVELIEELNLLKKRFKVIKRFEYDTVGEGRYNIWQCSTLQIPIILEVLQGGNLQG
ncbi:MAG: hypothetical protein MUF42_14230 [Cytophagaceae bacterium]|nr:hypothetical protein [Cytophagaceae bacterium]